ncbi:MAG: AraC family transcriptional regulator [Bacillota bacterium]|nr:AraC family transcriptional regulator [Bacillota bacterium]
MLTNFDRNLELADGLETDYLRILYYDFPEKFSSIYKSYEYNRLCTIVEGEKHISINGGSKFSYNTDQFILMPRNSNIFMDIDTPTKALVFELNDDLLKRVSEKISIDYEVNYNSIAEDKFFRNQLTNGIKDSLNKISSVLSEQNKNSEFLLDLYAQELVYGLLQIKGTQHILNFEPNNPVYKAIKYMQDNLESPLTIRQISSDLNMSEPGFCQYFKKVTGVSPKEYLTNLKLLKAKDMIKNSSITNVAFDLGYENISYFISLFKNKYGITPKQYKKIDDNFI